ncbi:hypothetical protein [Candidatus Spongiihabitans sp.]|uniref:hypothetical protein n=1 Tax=Candidatus Spongiihabitans sp. TaxID=3101308 RepID=UPI003C7C5097
MTINSPRQRCQHAFQTHETTSRIGQDALGWKETKASTRVGFRKFLGEARLSWFGQAGSGPGVARDRRQRTAQAVVVGSNQHPTEAGSSHRFILRRNRCERAQKPSMPDLCA